jgi:hypothetical protein
MALSVLVGLTILVIGESHMSLPTYLLYPLTESLSNQGAKVIAVGACGASAQDWLRKTSVPCGAVELGKGKALVKGRDATNNPNPLDAFFDFFLLIVLGSFFVYI